MSGSLNKVQIIGRLGADPEIKQMVNGKNVARLSVATSQSWKDKSSGERKEKTEWHRVVIFNEGLVNIVQQYLKKGANVYLEGQLSTRKWRDEKLGQDKYSTEVVLQGYNSSLTMLDGRNKSTNSNDSANDIATTVYAVTSDATAYAEDYVGFDTPLAIEFKPNDSTKTITVQTKIDDATESSDEYFWFDLFKTKADIDDYIYEVLCLDGEKRYFMESELSRM